eukprot:gene2183-2501_t
MLKGVVLEGSIIGYNKGGVLVQMDGLKGFLPYTKLAPERLKAGHKGDLSYLMGKRVKARIVQVDKESVRKELVLSERQALLTEQILQYKLGQVVRGQVLRLEDYGALMTIYNSAGQRSGVQGLLHKSEMSWDVVMTVDDIVQMGQELDLKVVSIDIPRCRVGLSLKQLQQDPLLTTMDSIQWRETAQAPPEIEQIVQVLQLTAGISKVALGRQAEEPHTVAQYPDGRLNGNAAAQQVLTPDVRGMLLGSTAAWGTDTWEDADHDFLGVWLNKQEGGDLKSADKAC